MGENLGILSLASDININHTIWKLLFNTVSSTIRLFIEVNGSGVLEDKRSLS